MKGNTEFLGFTCDGIDNFITFTDSTHFEIWLFLNILKFHAI